MALNDFVSQMVLLTFTILAGVATWLATRKRRTGDEPAVSTAEQPPQTKPTILNGYATVLQKALDRAEWLQERIRALEMRNDELERQLNDCQRREAGQPGTRHASPRKRNTATTRSKGKTA